MISTVFLVASLLRLYIYATGDQRQHCGYCDQFHCGCPPDGGMRCELYVIKIGCRVWKFRDPAHPHVLIMCCCGITWARPPVFEDSQSQQECIACAAAVASLEAARNGHETGWKSVSLSVSGLPQTFFALCSGKNTWDKSHPYVTRITELPGFEHAIFL